MNRLAKLPPPGRRSPAVVDAGHHVPVLGQQPVPQHRPAHPFVADRLPGGFTIGVEQQRVLLVGLEVGGRQHPGIERLALASLDPHQFDLGATQGLELRLQLGVVLQHAHHFVPGQPHQCMHRRRGEGRMRVHGEFTQRVNLVRVPARGVGRGDPLLCRAIEPGPMQVPPGRLVGGSREIDPPLLGHNPLDGDHVEVPRGDAGEFACLRIRGIQLPPPAPLAHPQERLAPPEPGNAVFVFDPGGVGLGEEHPRFAGLGLHPVHGVAILQAVELLDQQPAGIGRPVEVGDVMPARVARQIEPPHVPPFHRDNADTGRRVLFAHLGVWNQLCLGIVPPEVVDQGHRPHARGVELPERHVASISRQSIPLANLKFLLVDPVPRAIDEVVGGVVGQRDSLAAGQLLREQVLVVHPDRAGAGRIQPGIQGRGGGLRRTKPGQFFPRDVVDPVLAPGVGAPHAATVREDQQRPLVVGEAKAMHRQGLAPRCGNQLRGGNQHLGGVGREIDLDQVAPGTGVGGTPAEGARRLPAEDQFIDPRGLKLSAAVQAIDGQQAGVGGCGLGGLGLFRLGRPLLGCLQDDRLRLLQPLGPRKLRRLLGSISCQVTSQATAGRGVAEAGLAKHLPAQPCEGGIVLQQFGPRIDVIVVVVVFAIVVEPALGSLGEVLVMIDRGVRPFPQPGLEGPLPRQLDPLIERGVQPGHAQQVDVVGELVNQDALAGVRVPLVTQQVLFAA